MLLGAHLSIAGGLHEALRAARRYRFNTLGLFVRNQRQWACPPLSEQAVLAFRSLRRRLGIAPVVAHGSYLLNLCGRPLVRRKSIAALAEDRRRCGRLGIEYLVIHPGSHADAGEGGRLIAEGLRHVLDASAGAGTAVLLETTAGAGHSIGGRFEELAEALERAASPGLLGVCLDTCHVFAAGYDIRTPQAYARTMSRFDAVIGLSRLKAVHLNDSRGELGSRLDRHEHIGKGRIGLEGFAHFLHDPRMERIPLILETPKGKDPRGRDWDRVNAGAIRRLHRARPEARSQPAPEAPERS